MLFMVFKFLNTLNLHVDFSLKKSSCYVLRTISRAQFFCLFNQRSSQEKTSESDTIFREFAIPLSENNPASKAFYLSEGERETLKSKQDLVLCLRCLCACVPQEVAATKNPQQHMKRRKQISTFSMLIERPRYVPVLSQQAKVDVLVPLGACVCTIAWYMDVCTVSLQCPIVPLWL